MIPVGITPPPPPPIPVSYIYATYMGFYPSEKSLQLTKYSFATINSAPSIDRGEHWIMIARLNKNY